MGTNWMAVDTNFPTFTGEESSKEQISAMLNYLFILKEQLQYSMRNLTLDNFNAAGLDALTGEVSKKLGEQIQLFQNQLSQLSGTVSALSAQVSEAVQMSSRMKTAETEITYLQEFAEDAKSRLTDLELSNGEQDQRIDELEQTQKTQDTQMTQLQTGLDEQEQRIIQLAEQVSTAVAGGISLSIGTAEPNNGPVIWLNTTQEGA